MGARLIPAEPVFVNNAEREVCERLAAQLGDDAVLLANVRLTDHEQDHEADLVVLIPDAGIVVVEVKGGSVKVDKQCRWWQYGNASSRSIDPVGQARRSKHALRTYVQGDPRWRDSSLTRVRWAHTVVTPYSTVPEDFALPDCSREMVHGREDQKHLARRIRTVAEMHETNYRVPTHDDVAVIVEILTGRNLMVREVMAEADDREARADRLTQEQAMILSVTRLLHRVEVRGGAGSGKTVLAMAQAKQLTRGFGERKAQRVALLCYSIGLGEWFKRAFEGAPRKSRPAFIGRFEELGREWGAQIHADRNDSHFWEKELPARMAELAAALPEGKKFDSIIVDEAQDFAEDWWVPLLAALKDPEEGGLYVYSDENQKVFERFGRPPVALVPLVLDHNLRNTRQIAESFGPLAPMRMRALGGDGPDVEFVQAAAPEALSVAEEQVLALLDDGWPKEHVALITTGTRHPEQNRLQEALSQEGYWRTFWESEDVFYGHVLGCKGLERRAVVLCVNEDGTRDRSKERLYVGLSRATDKLVVVGDATVIRATGGEEIAKRLGIT
ncbi:nuclease-related domain-containing DEAD/DEAH box helicase [Ornithinimicrobium cerasi]|uniref:Nuclease-related domain-containing protein n=1 Tax=Ornithinimicrobium cerasi TaxID=2248773 RepID=A0A285VDV8_9MICO|nr:NERD domain-containing protein [Ornithinimicrobium cerasi]SOC52322.1 Nuclease-related domain-containing protein [Ornithinimicrobium cerasi]